MRPAWILGALGAILTVVVVVAVSRGNSESKRAHCQSLAHQEHAECVAELREEEDRGTAAGDSTDVERQPAGNTAATKACLLDSTAHQEACEQGYRGGMEAEDREAMNYVCEDLSASSDTELFASCTLGFEAAQDVKVRRIEAASGPLQNIGTITVSDEAGTSFRDHFQLGPLLDASEVIPQAEVLAACNLESPAIIDKSVFARGLLGVSYTEGSLPESIAVDPEDTVAGNELYDAVFAYQAFGKWICHQEELPQWEVQPGETRWFPFWFIASDIRSNAQPEVPAEVFNSWFFRFVGPLPALQGTTKITGPGLASCKSYGAPEPRLYLYSRSGEC
jgi:hypothetical protein